ncbi:hypothetical protein G9C98_002174 [Cotesia typhae]|uniref:ERCC1-like central domain-containing protein n=1 Tax=Cotesia typhae TaxID=2053667 RepID=A0A8J5QY56_9HYME|nr:hypothetical protein G9C98_002174 [Cotesia typhae]
MNDKEQPPAKIPKVNPGPSAGISPFRNAGSSILVNFKQRGNPLLKFIKSVPWKYSEVVPDYVMGSTTCALFLSIKICILADLTLMLVWSNEDAARIIETYKIFEYKPPEMIMERGDSDPQLKLISALTSVRSVNKTDALTLLRNFGTIADILKASPETLSLCPGFGIQKAKRLHKVLHEPFLRNPSSSPVKSN